MRGRFVALALVALIGVLSWAAVEFLPSTMYFPVVRYSVAGVDLTILRRGELDAERCESATQLVVDAITRSCAACVYAARCVQGLEAAHRKALSTRMLDAASLRSGDRQTTMVVSAPDGGVAAAICRSIESQSAREPPSQRLRCFPAGVERS